MCIGYILGFLILLFLAISFVVTITRDTILKNLYHGGKIDDSFKESDHYYQTIIVCCHCGERRLYTYDKLCKNCGTDKFITSPARFTTLKKKILILWNVAFIAITEIDGDKLDEPLFIGRKDA